MLVCGEVAVAVRQHAAEPQGLIACRLGPNECDSLPIALEALSLLGRRARQQVAPGLREAHRDAYVAAAAAAAVGSSGGNKVRSKFSIRI